MIYTVFPQNIDSFNMPQDFCSYKSATQYSKACVAHRGLDLIDLKYTYPLSEVPCQAHMCAFRDCI